MVSLLQQMLFEIITATAEKQCYGFLDFSEARVCFFNIRSKTRSTDSVTEGKKDNFICLVNEYSVIDFRNCHSA